MHAHVLKESVDRERRVAATPESVKRLLKAGFSVSVTPGAGRYAGHGDDEYVEAGATLDDVTSAADVLLCVQPPSGDVVEGIKEGALVIGLLDPYEGHGLVDALNRKRISSLALELVPRISRAQSMDALSSQANIAGYKAVLIAAARLDKYFPLLMTAAGTVQPARVVIMGAGVAGLQAIATAKRLGAVVEVSDIRPEVKEQVQSLGGRFIELPQMQATDDGGYATAVTPEFLAQQRAIVTERLKDADAVITTALVPGGKAPVLITEQMVDGMRAGSVIVDLAVERGGNCGLSKLDEEVVHRGVIILGPGNLPATVSADASMLYARNVLALLQHVCTDGAIQLDLEDEIVQSTLLTHEGQVHNGRVKQALGKG